MYPGGTSMRPSPHRATPDLPRWPRLAGPSFGRGEELSELTALLTSGEQLVTVVGPPGVGKTRLALAAARGLAGPIGARGGSVHVCDLRDARGVLDICRGMASALDVPLGADAALHVARVLGWRPPSLFVLDNFEHLAAHGPETVALWLAAAPATQILVTSREALRLNGERVLSLAPLPLPAGPEDVWSSDAGRLFADRAQAARAGYVPGEPDAAAVSGIVQQLEGIPLAIELAAAQMAHMDPPQILAAVRRSQTALASHRRDAPPRHVTLRAAIEASWRSLSAAEQRVLSCASLFRGGFTLEAAAAILDGGDGHAPPLVRTLHEKSLLKIRRPDPALPSRFSMYEAVRELAAAKAAPDDLERTAIRHAAWYLAIGEAAANTLDVPGGATEVRALLAETDNLVAVVTLALASRPARCDAALRAALALDVALAFRGPARFHLELLDSALSASGPDTSPITRARALAARARLRRLCGPLDSARADLEAALALVSGHDRPDMEATILQALATLACDAGERTEALALLQKALDRSRAAADSALEGEIRSALGTVARLDGRPLDAEEHYRHACSLLRRSTSRRGELLARSNLLSLRAELDSDDVVEDHARVVALADELFCAQIQGQAHASMGVWLHRRGRLAEARSSAERALEIFRRIGDERLAASVLANLGTVLHEQGELEPALDRYEQALSTVRAVGAHHAETMFLALIGGALAALDLLERARAVLDEAERRPHAVTDPVARQLVALSRAHLDLAMARRALREGDAERAITARRAALQRIDAAEGRGGGMEVGPALVERWTDALLTVRILRQRLATDPPIEESRHRIVIDARDAELRYEGGRRSLARRPVVRGLLYELADAAGEPVAKEVLCERVFGRRYRPERDDNPLRVNMNRLRILVEPSGLRVEFAGGYRLIAPGGFLYLRAARAPDR